jgi:superfamily I DNA/RNA helicase
MKKFNVDEKRQASLTYVMNNLAGLVRQHLIDVSNHKDVINLAEKYDLSFDTREYRMFLLLLKRMDRDNHDFDFTDMIYRTVIDNIKLPKFDYIFVDEAQDLSKIQQIIISRIKKRKGRMIAVGDPAQAIYGFAGADNNSYNNLKSIFDNTIELPLSVNYRCGKKIVQEAQQLNPQIKPYKNTIDGEVYIGNIDEIKSGDWVLSRNLKPLVQLNMFFLAKKRKSFIKGIDIGINLVNLVKKTGRKTIPAVINSIEQNIEKAKQKLRKRGVINPSKTQKIDNKLQKLDVINILSKNLTSSTQLINRIKNIFKEQGEGVMLSTIHKAKGLENDNVFLLSPELIPSKYAIQEWQLQQEWNLMYVAITRAKKKLVYIDPNSFKEIQIWLKKNI